MCDIHPILIRLNLFQQNWILVFVIFFNTIFGKPKELNRINKIHDSLHTVHGYNKIWYLLHFQYKFDKSGIIHELRKTNKKLEGFDICSCDSSSIVAYVVLLVGPLVGWSIGRSVHPSVCPSVCLSVGQPFGRFNGRSVDWSVGWSEFQEVCYIMKMA